MKCTGVNGFLKYAIETSNDRNLRNVITSVTVSDEHSVVNVKTDLAHTYCVAATMIKYNQCWKEKGCC